jgi:hypothetical protein
MPEQAAIELNGTLTLGDLAKFHYFNVYRKSKAGFFAAVFVVVGIIGLGKNVFDDGRLTFRALPFVVLLFWVFLLNGVLPYWSARRQMASQKSLAEPLCLNFTPRVIRRTSPSISSEIAWSIVREIYETRSLFLVYIAVNQAIVVPKRFFRDDAAIEGWKELAKSQTERFVENNLVARWC